MNDNVVNLTPHPITFYRKDELDDRGRLTEIATYGSSGVLRCSTSAKSYQPDGWLVLNRSVAPIHGEVPIVTPPEFSGIEPEELLEAARGKHIIVSMLVGQELAKGGPMLKKALGLLGVSAPDTDKGVVRDDNGRIIGTTRLIRYL